MAKKKKVTKQEPKQEPKQAAGEEQERQLTAKQALFVKHYVHLKNASQAAKLAGYSEDNADSLGYQNLQIPLVRAAIQKELKQQNERLDLTADRVLLELFRIATVDLSEAYSEGGALKLMHNIPEDVRRAIAGVETREECDTDGNKIADIVKLKFVDKNRALESLAKHFKLLTDVVELTDKTALAQRLNSAKSRKRK